MSNEDFRDLETAGMELKELFDATPAGVLVIDSSKEILYSNQTFYDLTGYNHTTHSTWQKMCRSAFPETEYRRMFIRAWNSGHIPFEVRFMCSNGAYRYFEIMTKPLNSISISSFLDVTEKVLAFNQYKRNRDLMNQLCYMTKVGIYEMNLLRRSAFWSDEVKSILELQGQLNTWQDFAEHFKEGESRNQVYQAFYQAEQRVENFSVDAIFVSEDKTERWIRVSMKSEFVDGYCVWIYGTVQDIHEQKRMEEELVAEKEQYERAQSIAQLGSWEWNFQTGEVYWSDEFQRICGIEPGSQTPNVDAGFALVHPDDRDHSAQAIEEAKNSGIPYKVVKRIIRPNGQQRWVRSQGEIISDKNGQAQKIVGTFLDITESKEAWDALEASEKRYRFLVDASTAAFAVWETDADGQINEKSSSWSLFTGQAAGEELGEGWLNAVHPDDRLSVEQRWHEAVADSKNPEADFRIQTPQGGWRWVRLVGRQILDPSGGTTKWIAMCIDINERKRATQEEIARKTAEASNSAKSIFLANMSHEIRTPLNAIIGFSHILERDVHMTETQLRHLHAITRSGEHLLNLINDILDLSRIEAGQLSLNMSNLDFYSLLEDMDLMFRFRAESRGLRFLFDRNANLPQYIQCDEPKLRQIFVNLLSNAVKFTDSGGIAVRIRADENHNDENPLDQSGRTLLLIVEIEDSGPGIHQTDLERIFESFQQSHEGIRSGGSGLGLAISRRLTELMEGDLSVKSTPGTGSIFRFSIPVGKADSAEAKISDPDCQIIGLVPAEKSARVLIVDDREDNRELLHALLEPCGFELKQAENGKIAVDIFEKWKPDVILMDMGMPIMDGYEATRIIKECPHGAQTCVVAVTASAFEENEAVIRATRVDDYIRKPFRPGDIYKILGEHLNLDFIMSDEMDGCVDDEDIVLTPEIMQSVPIADRQTMLAAVEMGNISELKTLIQLIEKPAIAGALLSLAQKYDYENLTRLLSPEVDPPV